MAPSRRTATKKAPPVKKAQPAKKAKPVKKVARKPAKPKDEKYIWIFGEPKIQNEAYEFHPQIQDFIEENFKNGKKTCRFNMYATVWTVNFTKMTRSCAAIPKGRPIQRITQSEAEKMKMKNLVGIENLKYLCTPPFQQVEPNCSICLSEIFMPTRNDICGHVFCFMCLKNNYMVGLECPTCRSRIRYELMMERTARFDLDVHLECNEEYANECREMFRQEDEKAGKNLNKRSERLSSGKHYWIFEARRANGWYRFDPQNEMYIEESYKRQKDECTLFLGGQNRKISFKGMTQIPAHEYMEHPRRKIKRIKATDIKKSNVRGIAGIDCVVYPMP